MSVNPSGDSRIPDDAFNSNMEYLEYLGKRDGSGWDATNFGKYLSHLFQGDGWTLGGQAASILKREVSNIQDQIKQNNGTVTQATIDRLTRIDKIFQSDRAVKIAAERDWKQFSEALTMEGLIRISLTVTQAALETAPHLFSFDVEQLCKSGQEYANKGSYGLAFACFKRASESKSASPWKNEALVRLGDLYAAGKGTEKSPKEALGYYLQASINGYLWGKLALADMYANGEGIKQDQKEADKIVKPVIDKGFPKELLEDFKGEVPHNMRTAVEQCVFIFRGSRVDRELVDSAIELLKFLANPENDFIDREYALYALGIVKEFGQGSEEKNIDEALAYYREAEKLGHKEATLALERIYKTLEGHYG
jgi:TPR repeat protein